MEKTLPDGPLAQTRPPRGQLPGPRRPTTREAGGSLSRMKLKMTVPKTENEPGISFSRSGLPKEDRAFPDLS